MFRFDGRPSIRRSLVMWLVLPLALLVPATAFLFYRLALAPALDSLDHALDGTALALERLVSTTTDGVSAGGVARAGQRAARRPLRRSALGALAPDGRVLGGDRELATLGGPPAAVDWRFFDATYEGQPVRVALHSWICCPPRRAAPQASARRASRRRSTSAGASPSRCWRRRRRPCWSRRWCWR